MFTNQSRFRGHGGPRYCIYGFQGATSWAPKAGGQSKMLRNGALLWTKSC